MSRSILQPTAWLAALSVLAAAMPAPAVAESVDAASLRVIATDPVIQATRQAATAADGTALHALVAQAPRPPFVDVTAEARAHALATGLRRVAPAPASRRWLTAVADAAPLARSPLPDAARSLQVPAFPVAAAARATLRSWQASTLAQALRRGVTTGVWPDAASADPGLLSQAVARLSDTDAMAVLRIWPSSLAVPAPVAWRHVMLRPGADAALTWLDAEARTPAATRLHTGLRAVLPRLDPADREGVINAALRQSAAAAALLIAALGELDAAWARERLGHLVHDHTLGLDAALALARGAGRARLRALAESDAAGPARRRSLIALHHAGETAYLRGWADNPDHPEALRADVRRWLP